MCEHRYLDDPDGLPCTRTDPHHNGHTYTGSAGPDLDQPAHHAKGDDQ